MPAPKIPESLNPELLTRANSGESTRDIAEWLVDAKHLASCSHMKVARRLQTLRAAEVAPPQATEADVERLLRANGELITDTIESLIDLEEAATYGDEERGTKPDHARAERLARRRGVMVENRQKYLMLRLNEARTARRLEQQRERENARRAETAARLKQTVARARSEFDVSPPRPVAAPPPRPIPPPAPVAAPPPPPQRAEPEPGRNAPCPCGSGRKWKKCHGGAVTLAVTLPTKAPAIHQAPSTPIG